MSKNYIIRDAGREDAAIILQFIRDLAEYEKLADQVVATEDDIRATLFDDSGRIFCLLAEVGGQPAGFALGFYNYSTFQGKYGIYLEDTFVRPEFRGQGIGKAFFRALAQKAIKEKCGRIQWWVLDWNEPSIEFYKSMNAVAMDEWTVMRLEGQAIADLAQDDVKKVA